MRKFFIEAAKADLFSKLKSEFYEIVQYELIKSIQGDKGIYTEPNFNGKNIQNIQKKLYKYLIENQKKIHETLFEFSMEEKFYFISEQLSNFEINKFSYTEDLFNNMIESEATLYYDSFLRTNLYGSHFFGDVYNSDENFKTTFIANFSEYAKCFFEAYEKLHLLFQSLDQQFKEGLLTDESKIEVNEFVLKHNPIYTLHPKLTVASIKNGKYKPSTLKECNQIAILFDVLCECGVFLNFDKKTKAFFASLFTGESEQKLREAFIDEVSLKGQKEYIPKNSIADYQRVIELVEEIKELLRSRIAKFQEK